jgi:hypothetical protein
MDMRRKRTEAKINKPITKTAKKIPIGINSHENEPIEIWAIPK